MRKVGSQRAPGCGRSLTGICLAAVYTLIVIGAYALATGGKPDEFGYRWIPFLMLAMPSYAFTERFFTPNSLLPAILGFILNASILYLLGMLIDEIWRRLTKKAGLTAR